MELSPVLSMYKRCSKYTTQTHTCRPDTPADFNQFVEMEIPRYGDFIKTIFVKMTLPPTYGVPTSGRKYIYTGSPGLHIFEYVELVIGDKVIERLDGHSMALYFMKHYGPLYNDVFDDALGGNPEQHFEYCPPNGLHFQPSRNNYNTNVFGPDENFNLNYVNNRNRTIFYPLPFYFFNKPSLALPICLLHQQEIKVRFKFRDWQDLIIADGETAFYNLVRYTHKYKNVYIYYGTIDFEFSEYDLLNYPKVDFSTIFGPLKLVDFSVPVEFAYISDDDYKFFSSKPCTYLINQTQRQVVDVKAGVFNLSTRLNFINPVKCIDFFVKYTDNNRNFYRNLYNMKANYARITSAKACMHHIESIQLDFDGETFLSNAVADYQFLTYVQKYKHDLGFYSFTKSDMWQSWSNYVIDPRSVFNTFKKMISTDNPYNLYAKSLTGPYYSYSFALDPLSENPCGYMNFSTIRNPYMKINMFSDIIPDYVVDIVYDMPIPEVDKTNPRQVYIYAQTINILTIDPIQGNATLKFQNPTYT